MYVVEFAIFGAICVGAVLGIMARRLVRSEKPRASGWEIVGILSLYESVVVLTFIFVGKGVAFCNMFIMLWVAMTVVYGQPIDHRTLFAKEFWDDFLKHERKKEP